MRRGMAFVALASVLGTLVLNVVAFLAARALAGAAFGVPRAWLPFRRFSRDDGQRPSAWARPAVAFAGPFASYLCAAALLGASVAVGGEVFSDTRVDVHPGRAAEAAGMQSGDRVASVNGAPIATFDELSTLVRAHPGEPMEIVVERDASQLSFSVTPGARGAPDEAKIGVSARQRQVDVGVGDAILRGFREPPRILFHTWTTAARFVAGTVEPVESAGPVAIVRTVASAHRSPTAGLLAYLGVLNSVWWFVPALAALALALFGWRPAPP
jgi:regulator of sigma E protease